MDDKAERGCPLFQQAAKERLRDEELHCGSVRFVARVRLGMKLSTPLYPQSSVTLTALSTNLVRLADLIRMSHYWNEHIRSRLFDWRHPTSKVAY
jgi:hypothetical protein